MADVLDDLCANGPRSGELERVQAQTETDFVASMQSAGDRAEQLSRFATYFGEPRLLNEHVARYRAVTDAKVRELSAERLRREGRASLVYVPRNGTGPS